MKTYIKPNIIVVKQMGSYLMLDTSGGGGAIQEPPRGKDFEIENATPSSPNLWDEEE